VWWKVNETEACTCDGVGLVEGSYPEESLSTTSVELTLETVVYLFKLWIMVHVTQCSTMNMGLCSHTISK
jgi:hypothetical protein